MSLLLYLMAIIEAGHPLSHICLRPDLAPRSTRANTAAALREKMGKISEDGKNLKREGCFIDGKNLKNVGNKIGF